MSNVEILMFPYIQLEGENINRMFLLHLRVYVYVHVRLRTFTYIVVTVCVRCGYGLNIFYRNVRQRT